MQTKIEVNHIVRTLSTTFEVFTDRIENQILKQLEPDWVETLRNDSLGFRSYINDLAGINGLILFGTQDHGMLLNVTGAIRKAKQYIIGNPMIAIRMTQLDIRAGLYAPLRVLVYEGKNKKSYVEYDLPSSLFGQFGDGEIEGVGILLNEKLQHLISLADA